MSFIELCPGESSGSTLNKYGCHLLRVYYSLGTLYILLTNSHKYNLEILFLFYG